MPSKKSKTKVVAPAAEAAAAGAETDCPPLPLEDLICPICLDIFIEPITLVCDHVLCRECFNEHFQKAEFKCPLCKRRLSSWARKRLGGVNRGDSSSLVNWPKWKMIQAFHGEAVERRRRGDTCPGMLHERRQVVVAKQGQLHEEYVKMRTEFETNRKRELDEEEAASRLFIKELLRKEREAEEAQQRAQAELDIEVARIVSARLNEHVSPSSLDVISLRSCTKKKQKMKKSPNAAASTSVGGRVGRGGSIKKFLSKSAASPSSPLESMRRVRRGKSKDSSPTIECFFPKVNATATAVVAPGGATCSRKLFSSGAKDTAVLQEIEPPPHPLPSPSLPQPVAACADLICPLSPVKVLDNFEYVRIPEVPEVSERCTKELCFHEEITKEGDILKVYVEQQHHHVAELNSTMAAIEYEDMTKC